MSLLSLLELLNGSLVLIFGLFLSVHISGGWAQERQRRLVILLYLIFLAIQAVLIVLFGMAFVQHIYPLIVHVPLVLILVFAMKRRIDIALFSVFTAYLCCQLPNWVGLLFSALTASALVGKISYCLVILPIYWMLKRHFVRHAYDAIHYSTPTKYLFGSLPLVYYVYDYVTDTYADLLPVSTPALTEFFTTAIIVFFIACLIAYRVQTRQRAYAELQRSVLEVELKQAGTELENLRRIDNQTAIYQHNMRHHLTAIAGFLSAGNAQQAQEYIQSVQADVEAITPKRYCENELVNLLCSSFLAKAEHRGVQLTIDAKVPQHLPLPDTALSSLLSNGLENALLATSELEDSLRWVRLACGIRAGKLLIEITNPYHGEVIMRDGLPVSRRKGHGFGCRSIHSIANRYGGMCTFETARGMFTLRVMLPIHSDG